MNTDKSNFPVFIRVHLCSSVANNFPVTPQKPAPFDRGSVAPVRVLP